MRERKVRGRAVRKHDVVDEGLEIDVVLVKGLDVALARVTRCALRAALPAPVEGRYCEPARAQVSNCLEVFLDELGATLKQANRAFASGRRRPARVTQRNSVRGLEHASDRALGHRIGGNRDEGHDLEWGAGGP